MIGTGSKFGARVALGAALLVAVWQVSIAGAPCSASQASRQERLARLPNSNLPRCDELKSRSPRLPALQTHPQGKVTRPTSKTEKANWRNQPSPRRSAR
jgi:hypothetical protein